MLPAFEALALARRYGAAWRILAAAMTLASVLTAQQWPRIEVNDEQAERQRWFYGQRTYPLGTIPPGARLNAVRRIQQMNAASRPRHLAGRPPGALAVDNLGVTMDSASWRSIGPQPTDRGTTAVTAGRVSAIAIDPRNSNVVYIGAAEGGVWKTTDGGANWLPLTDGEASLASGSIAIDPANPETVYVGTGEENFYSDNYYGAGILKSTDGGATWSNIVGPFLRDSIGALAIQPGNSSILLCASKAGVWRSADAGATWTNTLAGTGFAVVFDPNNGSSAYAALGSTSGSSSRPAGSVRNGVYHSVDGGLTWSAANGTGASALPAGTAIGRIDLAMAPSNPATMYVQAEDAATSALLGIWKTTDGGVTWNALPIPGSQIGLWGPYLWYYNVIRVSPTNPNVVWSGGIQVFRSVDGGATWVALPWSGSNNNVIHVDFHALAFTSDGRKLYLGNDGGMYSTTDITASKANWTNLNETLAITQFYPGMSVDLTNPAIALAGTQDNGTQLYQGPSTWSYVTCGDGGFTALDPTSSAFGYAMCQGISVQRTAGLIGRSAWIRATYGIDPADPTQTCSPLVMDLANPQTLYFGTYRLWRTEDSAGRWNAVSADLTGGRKGALMAVAVAPSDSNTVYIGTSNGKVRVSNDLQHGSDAAWNDRTAGLPNSAITHISVDPVDANTAYVTFSGFNAGGHVFKTADGGTTWANISGDLPNLPVNDLVADPDLPQTLYIGTDAGVMVTIDGGATWSTLGNGLPLVVVESLVLQRGARVLRAATHGRSVWEILVPIPGGRSLQPSIASLSPGSAASGDPGLTMIVTGANFVPSTVAWWNGQPRPTTFVDSSHLAMAIPASDVATLGRATVAVFNPVKGGGPSNPATFSIGAGPQSTAQSVVSAANPRAGNNNLAMGGIASVYGLNLAAGTSVADLAPPLPFTLGGATLTMSGGAQPVPLFFVSPNQINFQVPFMTAGVQQLTITQGTRSVTIPVTLVNYAPALFSTNAQGTGQAAALIANTSIVAAPAGMFPDSRPAKIGEYVSIYCTGLGDTSNRPALGSASPANPSAATLAQARVTIGGAQAKVSFSGLAPGYVGLYQVNAQIPDSAPRGESVPIVLTIGGAVSNTVTIAVDLAQE